MKINSKILGRLFIYPLLFSLVIAVLFNLLHLTTMLYKIFGVIIMLICGLISVTALTIQFNKNLKEIIDEYDKTK